MLVHTLTTLYKHLILTHMTSRRVLQSLVSGARNQIIASKHNVKKTASNMWDAYEDLIGVRETRRIHESVLSAENMFVAASKTRREVQSRLSDIQQNLKQVRQKLDSISRTDETYLELVTREHQLFKDESKLVKDLMQQENVERDLFNTYSQNVRNCQEVERMRQEKTKYLSLMGSLIGAALGIIGTSINHALKNRDFKKILQAIESQNHKEEFNIEEHVLSKDDVIAEKVSSQVIDYLIKQKKPHDETQIMERINASESALQQQISRTAIYAATASYIMVVLTLPLIARLCGD